MSVIIIISSHHSSFIHKQLYPSIQPISSKLHQSPSQKSTKMHTTSLITLSALVSAAAAAKHVVKVGDGGLTFSPESTTAAVGDTVEFHFYPMAHSVAQSSFAKPCEPLNSTSFFSGPVAVSSGVSDKVFTVTVENETPIWFYCATGDHCQEGMVGAINAA